MQSRYCQPITFLDHLSSKQDPMLSTRSTTDPYVACSSTNGTCRRIDYFYVVLEGVWETALNDICMSEPAEGLPFLEKWRERRAMTRYACINRTWCINFITPSVGDSMAVIVVLHETHAWTEPELL
ncbi:hypothetical protein VNO77_41668 [Canavalia gladiata]|uniref:Uncharacterized protein n=1 Tax=Canavalia gladiata TaxID=3824 RepID=A0AAN9PS07_CANGL